MPSADAERILKALARHRTFADLTDGNAGRDLCKIATDGVREMIEGQVGPDGSRWDELSDDYARWKEANFPGQPMGVLHFLMSDPAQISGVPAVAKDRASVAYGTSPQAQDEFHWFNAGDPGANRPARPCWGFSAQSKAEADAYLLDRLRKKL